ncbi:hypothetical protein K458DRAFT_446675 [Lentithecium fluviatile CBS 122367]|uniref:Uncharacterized protein n=1 Tax=Lentithecium fluviatile CBS 122367 TaxID=1168545 RepID=A0A6G1IIL4_9PLEO|nr:hypothetical protein K458DRAFT_446675 [Lentithecium fluviatile CBS 122367]
MIRRLRIIETGEGGGRWDGRCVHNSSYVHTNTLEIEGGAVFVPALAYPQKNLTVQLHNARVRADISSTAGTPGDKAFDFPKISDAPGEQFELRKTDTSEDCTPDPSKSLKLSPGRQALVDDRARRYTPYCVTTTSSASVNEGYQVIRSDDEIIRFENRQFWTFHLVPKTAIITGLIKYHKDQANDKDYLHKGVGLSFKKWKADNAVKHMDAPELKEFEADRNAAKEHVQKYGTGKEEGSAPMKDVTK